MVVVVKTYEHLWRKSEGMQAGAWVGIRSCWEEFVI
jgi:hypothetical protein